MIRVAEPLAWEVDVEPVFAGRQLRLVDDQVAVPESPVFAPVGPTPGFDAPASATGRTAAAPGAVVNLATLVEALAPGSDCFWCGGTLVGEGHARLRLVCSSCGAEVEGPRSVHEADVRL